jgi:cytochrome P450
MADQRGREIPVIEADFNDRSFNQDPFPVLERWRALGPVVYNAKHDVYMTFSYRDCAKVIGNLSQFDSSIAAESFVRSFGGVTMEAIDSPRHHEMRGVWAREFQRDSLQEQRRLVTEVVDARLGPFVQRVRSGEHVDAVTGLTRGIPTLVIARMLGIESERHEEFSDWSDAIGGFSEARTDKTARGEELVRKGVAASRALNGYLGQVVEDRRAAGKGGDDLVSKMVFHEFANQMAEDEIVASVTQLVFAGNETTAKLMASTMVALAAHPDQRRALVADRSLIPQAIEEVLRWSTVVTNLQARHACSPHSEIQGIPIPVGSAMAPLIAAANRDPKRWEDPHRFDISRPPKQHLGFGFGMHVCLGLNLARLETEIWLDRLLDELPDFEVVGPVDYGTNFMLRGPLAVPIGLAAG